jgi:hypothetical protein
MNTTELVQLIKSAGFYPIPSPARKEQNSVIQLGKNENHPHNDILCSVDINHCFMQPEGERRGLTY